MRYLLLIVAISTASSAFAKGWDCEFECGTYFKVGCIASCAVGAGWQPFHAEKYDHGCNDSCLKGYDACKNAC